MVKSHTINRRQNLPKNEGSTVTSQTSEILLLDGRFELLHSLPLDDAEPWPDGLNQEELSEWIEPMLAHCTRPTDRTPSVVQRSDSSVAP